MSPGAHSAGGSSHFFSRLAQNESVNQIFIWGVLFGVISAVGEPALTDLTQEAWNLAAEHGIHRSLPPPELAAMVVRGWMSQDDAAAVARMSGMSTDDFALLVNVSRNPPGPQQLAEMLRRGIIPADGPPGSASFGQGIIEGNLGDQWTDKMKELAREWPTPSAVLAAALKGYPFDHPEQVESPAGSKDAYERVGGAKEWFDMALYAEGSAPTPVEAAAMARRGIIPESGTGATTTSYEQAFLEGPWRDKWRQSFWQLSAYYPPLSDIRLLYETGAITPDEAATYMHLLGADHTVEGMSGTVGEQLLAAATTDRIAGYRQLTESNVADLLLERAITPAEAKGYFEHLGYSSAEAESIVEETNLRYMLRSLRTGISKIGTYYVGHKITWTQAAASLANLNVPNAQAEVLKATWDAEAVANLKTLTESQIVDGWEYGALTQDEAMSELQGIGYTPFDAWVLMSNKAKKALPNKPERTVASPSVSTFQQPK